MNIYTSDGLALYDITLKNKLCESLHIYRRLG